MAGKGGLAKEVRAGLELAEPKAPAVQPDFLDELWFRKPIRQHIREFAQVFALIFLAIAGVSAYRHGANWLSNSMLSAAIVILLGGYKTPKLLHPLWKGWMAIGHGLGVVMSTVILAIAWTIVLLPMAALLKLIGKKVMDTTYGAPVQSYWENRDPKLDNFKLLERQY